MKSCSRCKLTKPLSSFSFYKEKKDGSRTPKTRCKTCAVEVTREYRIKHPEKVKLWNAKTKLRIYYDLSWESYQKMVDDQNGVCAICSKPPTVKALCVDHSHATNVVRGLLCDKCNQGLGRFNDDPIILKRAISYLTHMDANVVLSSSRLL